MLNAQKMLNAQIEQQEKLVAKLKAQLEAEQQKESEMKDAEPLLVEAKSLLQQAIAKTDRLPQWLKEEFWETFEEEVKDALLIKDYSGLKLDNCFHFIESLLADIVTNFQESESEDYSYWTGNLEFNPQNATWCTNVYLNGSHRIHGTIVLTMLSILPPADERMPSVDWLGSLNNWTWGVDAKSNWYQEIKRSFPSLLNMLLSIEEIYQNYVDDCLNAIAEKQIVSIKDMETQFAGLTLQGLWCVLEDLQRGDRIVFMDEKRALLYPEDGITDFTQVASVCWKNTLSGNQNSDILASEVVLMGEKNKQFNLDSDFNSGAIVGTGLVQSNTQPTEKKNPFKIQVVPGKGIKWEENGSPDAFSHKDFVNWNNKNNQLNLYNYKRDTLKAIASYMGLSDKGKIKENIWERIRAEYLNLCAKAPNNGVTNFEGMVNEA